jgi:uncharacterized membrane protein YeaQ/YmgE (transglycosylase-associated protein family)
MSVLWTIIIGFVAGVIAKLLHRARTSFRALSSLTILGIVGAFLATCLGQAIGWYNAGRAGRGRRSRCRPCGLGLSCPGQ